MHVVIVSDKRILMWKYTGAFMNGSLVYYTYQDKEQWFVLLFIDIIERLAVGLSVTI